MGSQPTVEGARGTPFVQSLERGLAVIRAFDGDHRQLTLSEVARRTGLPRAAARRFLHTLVELGYVRTDGRVFSLRPRVLDLGYAYLSSTPLPEVAQPHLEDLVARVHESCSVSVLDGEDIVYVARVATQRLMTVAIDVGTRFPAYATSMGRVLLAARPAEEQAAYLSTARLEPLTLHTVTDRTRLAAVLAEVAIQGFAVLDQELAEGLRSIAVPVHDAGGGVVSAMTSPPRRAAAPRSCAATSCRRSARPPSRSSRTCAGPPERGPPGGPPAPGPVQRPAPSVGRPRSGGSSRAGEG